MDAKREGVISAAKDVKRLVSPYEYEVENIPPETVNTINEGRNELEQTLAQFSEENLTTEAAVTQLASQLQHIAQEMAPNSSGADTPADGAMDASAGGDRGSGGIAGVS